MAEDYYATLGVPRTATPEEIHKAYRNLARKYHPDLNPDDEDAKKKFQEIQHAYETLKDPKKRDRSDVSRGLRNCGAGGGGERGDVRDNVFGNVLHPKPPFSFDHPRPGEKVSDQKKDQKEEP